MVRPGSRRPPGQDGFALLIVLWSLALLALLATGLAATGRSDALLAANVRRAAAAQDAADGGVAAAVFHVAAPGSGWLADGNGHSVTFGRYAIAVTVRDESRKVNPNYAPPELMGQLLIACGADAARAQAISAAMTQWHVPGDRAASAAPYLAAGLPGAPTGALFGSVDDVGLVIGMSPALLECLRPHLSVYAKGPPDFAQADPVVRAALLRLGTDPAAAAPPHPAVLDILADAGSRDGSRFVRHAVVALGQTRAGLPFAIYQWDTPPP